MAVSNTGSSTSSWSSMFGIKNNGIGGLVSGLDTESLVKALTSGTQLKITKQQQQRQLLTWRQDGYRSIITALHAFQKKSFQNSGTTKSTTNMLNSDFFSTYKSTSSSDKISVSAGANATLGEIMIDNITQMATAQSLKSKDLGDLDVGFASDLLTKTFASATAFSGQTVRIDFNGSTKTLKLDDLNAALEETPAGSGNYRLGEDEFKTAMQNILDKNFAKTSGGDPNVLLIKDSVTGTYKLISETGRITTNSSNALLGLQVDKSNHLSTSNTLADLESFFGDKFDLQGNTLSFSINDTVFTVNRGDTIASVMSKINGSNAGVRIDYSGNTGRFTMTAKTTGGADNIVVKDISGNLMNQLFGAQGGGSLASSSLIKTAPEVSGGLNPWANAVAGKTTDAEKKAALQSLAKSYKTFDLTIDGVTKAVKVDLSSIKSEKLSGGTYTEDEYINAINASIKYAFGTDDVQLAIARDNSGNSTGRTRIVSSKNSAVTFGEGAGAIGFAEGQSNYVSDINYNGKIDLGAMSLTKDPATGNYQLPGDGKGTVNVTIGNQSATIEIDLSELNGLQPGSTAAKEALERVNAKIAQELNSKFGTDLASKVNLKMSDPFEIEYKQQVKTASNGIQYEVYKEQKSVTSGGKTYYEFKDGGTTVYGDEDGNFYKKNGSSYDALTPQENADYTSKLANGTMRRVAGDKTVYVDQATGDVYSDNDGDLGAIIPGRAYDPEAGYVSVLAAQQATYDDGTKTYKGYVDKTTQKEYFQDENGDFFTYSKAADGTVTMTAATVNAGNLDLAYNYGLRQSVGLSLGVANDVQVTISADAADAAFFNEIGFNGTSQTNYSPNVDTKLSDLADGIGLKGSLRFMDDGGNLIGTVNYDSSMSSPQTLREFAEAVSTVTGGKVTVSAKDGRLSITGANGKINITDDVEPGMGGMLKNVFKLDDNNYKTDKADDDFDPSHANSRMTMGKNMEIVINGQSQSFATNSITIDGVNITVKGENTGPVTINTVSDATETIDRLKTWMEDYNALVHTLNKAVTETRPKSNGSLYEPLTDEQKAEMSESEINKWEEKAKTGMLYNDSAIKTVLSEMRQALYERVEAAGLSLWDLGIQTVNSLDPLEYGKLEFAPADYSKSGMKGEERLKKLLETEPDKVRQFFQGVDGLGNRINDIISKAANTSSVNRGTLVTIAGAETNTGDNTSTLGNKMDEIDKYISNLKLRLESEYNRYWKQFTALETAVNKMNSQSSWLQSSSS